MDCKAVTEQQQHNYSPHTADSAQFGIHEVALNTWQSGAFTPVAAIGKKRVEAKQQSCLSLEPLSIQGSINTICSPYRWLIPPVYREYVKAIGSR